jgi:vacuolar-type H+-ATPase subunit I/STV1
MIEEFKRFGLTAFQRKATGILQLLGAIGLILSYFSLWIGLLSAMGLTSMMLVAFMVRISIKDSVLQSIPAFIFLLVNSWITYAFFDLLW